MQMEIKSYVAEYSDELPLTPQPWKTDTPLARQKKS
jgi:hypothetical protein